MTQHKRKRNFSPPPDLPTQSLCQFCRLGSASSSTERSPTQYHHVAAPFVAERTTILVDIARQPSIRLPFITGLSIITNVFSTRPCRSTPGPPAATKSHVAVFCLQDHRLSLCSRYSVHCLVDPRLVLASVLAESECKSPAEGIGFESGLAHLGSSRRRQFRLRLSCCSRRS